MNYIASEMLNKTKIITFFLAFMLIGFISGCEQTETTLPDLEKQEDDNAHNSTKANDSKEVFTSRIIAVTETQISNIDSNKNVDANKKDEPTIEETDFSSAIEHPKSLNSPQNQLFCLEPKIKNNIALVEQTCKKMSDRLASVKYKSCLAAKLKITGCNSVKGTPILAREFPPLKGRKPNGRILVIGGTHGDELTSVSVTMRWINQLSKNHTGLFHWHIAPIINPDAVFKKSATRTNHNGVDLNRNMPSTDWNENALKYWRQKSNKDKRKYPGPKAASEPETQWLIDEINSFKPDAIISVHAPYGVVDFDSLLLSSAPKKLGKLYLNMLGTYPGSLGSYAGINRDIPVITLELPHSWVMPSVSDSDRIWRDIVKWLKKNVNNDLSKQ